MDQNENTQRIGDQVPLDEQDGATRRFSGQDTGLPSTDQVGQWVQNYQNGNHDQVPHQQVHQAYQQWAQTAPPQHVGEAVQQGYQQVPAQQRPGIADTLLNLFHQHGMDPQAAGVQTTNPQQMSSQDLAKMTQYAQQQQPDVIGKLFQPGGALSNPAVGLALAGALAFGLSRLSRH